MTAQPQLALPIGEEQHGEIRTYTLTLPFTPKSKNVYDSWPNEWKRGHKRKWMSTLADQFAMHGIPKGALKVGMHAALVFPTKGRRDKQNYANCLWNFVPDALVAWGAIPDDTPEFVEIGPNWGITLMHDTRVNVSKSKRARTHLTLAFQMPPED